MDTREYELMYIVRPTVADDQFSAIIERVDSMVSGLGGEVTQNQPWGKRRLAYPIDNHEDGYYVVSKIRLDSGKTRDLEEQRLVGPTEFIEYQDETGRWRTEVAPGDDRPVTDVEE